MLIYSNKVSTNFELVLF